MLHCLFFFGIFFYLHGLIRTYTFIHFWEKFLPTSFLLRPTRALISENASHLHGYWDPTLIRNSRVWHNCLYCKVNKYSMVEFDDKVYQRVDFYSKICPSKVFLLFEFTDLSNLFITQIFETPWWQFFDDMITWPLSSNSSSEVTLLYVIRYIKAM